MLRKRVLGYLRVSSDMQVDDGHSLASQEALIRDWCQREYGEGNYLLHLERDEGMSGSLPYNPPKPGSAKFRPGLGRVVEQLRRGEADFLVVYRLNRLFRDHRQQLNFIAEFFAGGPCKLIALAEQLDLENIQGQLTANLLGAVSDYERKQIAQNLRIANAARRKDGFPTGQVGYGWRRENRVPGLRTGISPHPEELSWVRRCFELALAGWGIRQIARELQRLGAPPPGTTGRWDDLKVHRLLQQPIHAGLICYKGETHRGRHWEHRVIEPEDFERVQQGLRSRHRERVPYDGKELLPLYNLGRCGSCGQRLRVVSVDDSVSYRCIGTVASGVDLPVAADLDDLTFVDSAEEAPGATESRDQCPGWARSAGVVDSTLLRLLSAVVRLPEFVALTHDEAQQIVLRETHEALTNKFKALQQQQVALERQLTRLVDLYIDERIARVIYDRKHAELKSTQETITAELRTVQMRLDQEQNEQHLLDRVRNRLWDLPEVWEVLTPSERRQLIADLTEYVLVERTAYRHARLRIKVHFMPEQIVLLPHSHSREGGYGAGVDSLSLRELALLHWLHNGRTIREVAELWGADPSGLHRMIKKILRRLEVTTHQEAVQLAWEMIQAHQDRLPLETQARIGCQDWRNSQEARIHQVLDGYHRGLDRRAIASELGLSVQSVRHYEWKACRHYNVSDISSAVASFTSEQQIGPGAELSFIRA